MTHNTVSGVAHFAAENDEDCLRTDPRTAVVHSVQQPGRSAAGCAPAIRPTAQTSLNRIVPEAPNVPYDIRDIIHAVVDDGYFFEVHEHYAKNIVVGFARLGGQTGGYRCESTGAPRRRAGYRCVGKSGAICTVLRLFQHPADHI